MGTSWTDASIDRVRSLTSANIRPVLIASILRSEFPDTTFTRDMVSGLITRLHLRERKTPVPPLSQHSPRPRAPLYVVPSADRILDCTLADLLWNGCRFIEGSSHNARWCNRIQHANSSYCSPHRKRTLWHDPRLAR